MKRDLKGMGMNKQTTQGAQTSQSAQTPQDAPTRQKPAQPVREQAKAQHKDINNINDAIEHYGGKSDAELMNELVNFRNQGVIDDGKLAEVAARLTPMLNAQQKKRLESVLGTLKSK